MAVCRTLDVSSAGVSLDTAAWFPLGTGVGDDETVDALAVLPNSDLIAGGNFVTAGGAQVNSIARWNGAQWFPLGSGMPFFATVYALLALPDGSVIAGGDFQSAGGSSASNA